MDMERKYPTREVDGVDVPQMGIKELIKQLGSALETMEGNRKSYTSPEEIEAGTLMVALFGNSLYYMRLFDKSLRMFEAAQDDFIFLFHIGDNVPPEKNPSCPYKLAALLDRFPRLRCIAGHLGGYHQWEHSLKALVGRDVWLDTSSCTPFIQPDLLKAILRKHPQDRILFGSDYPLYDPGDAMMHLQEKAELGDADLDRYCSNADALFA